MLQVGAPPPPDGDTLKWASSVKTNPVPMFIRTRAISIILERQFMGGKLDEGFVETFRQALRGYCGYLQDRGEIKPDVQCPT